LTFLPARFLEKVGWFSELIEIGSKEILSLFVAAFYIVRAAAHLIGPINEPRFIAYVYACMRRDDFD